MEKQYPFDWDDTKNAINWRKHGVRFEDAQELFDDPYVLDLPDLLHSQEEERWIALGMLPDGRMLTVVYVERDDKIRLISARAATPSEVRSYAIRRR
jgi:uncharacterized DUF497 family protein